MRRATLTIAAAVVAALAAGAVAETIKVPGDFNTIQEAVDNAQPGDKILISKGIYSEKVNAAVPGLQFVGKKGAIWDGTPNGNEGVCLSANADNVQIKGITFRAGDGLVEIDGNGAIIEKCEFESSIACAIDITGDDAVIKKCDFFGTDGGVSVSGNDTLVEKCDFLMMIDRCVDINGDRAVVVKCDVRVCENGPALDVDGNDALVERNEVLFTGGESIFVIGDGGTINKNECRGSGFGSINYEGNGSTITGNKVAECGEFGIFVFGDDHTIDKNNVRSMLLEGIEAFGAGIVITNNKIDEVMRGVAGIHLNDNGTAGGGRIEGNKVNDVVEAGILVMSDNVDLFGNRVTNCGAENQASILMTGDGNEARDNAVTNGGDDGFRVTGDNNVLADNVVKRCAKDGYDIAGGTGNGILDCDAFDCLAEGLDNSGSDTSVIGGKFAGSRIDVANDGTFASFDPKSLETGGEATLPERD